MVIKYVPKNSDLCFHTSFYIILFSFSVDGRGTITFASFGIRWEKIVKNFESYPEHLPLFTWVMWVIFKCPFITFFAIHSILTFISWWVIHASYYFYQWCASIFIYNFILVVAFNTLKYALALFVFLHLFSQIYNLLVGSSHHNVTWIFSEKKTVGIAILAGFAVGLSLGIPVTMIIFGYIHVNDCPAERFIPIYLIVGGNPIFNYFFYLYRLWRLKLVNIDCCRSFCDFRMPCTWLPKLLR